MRRLIACGGLGVLLMASCQRELHFPPKPVAIIIPEKVITAIIVYNPLVGDYDSIAFHYTPGNTKEIHYQRNGNSITRTFSYDAAGRLASVEDEKAIYYTNNDRALRIQFEYNASGQLVQTKTDFTRVAGITAHILHQVSGTVKQMEVYDTAYRSDSYNLDWVNRVIYSTINSKDFILTDSSILTNTSYAGLVTTIVSEYNYDSDTSVSSINKRVYSNGQLTESGIAYVTRDKPAPVFSALRKKLYRNLSNWFDASEVWQDTSYDLFPLPGGPYKSILYNGLFAGNSQPIQSFVRTYEFENNYRDGDLDNAKITYTLTGQGSSNYITWLKFYYDYQ